MQPTRLIIIEGPPGSGKSTTAYKLAERVRQEGLPCRAHLEWDADHPIPIGSDLELDKVIATARRREGEMLAHWQRFGRERQAQPGVTILESRFWQTSLMLMFAAGHPLEGLFAAQQQVVEALLPLQPALVLYTIDDLRSFTARTIEVKEEEWRRGGFPGTWIGHIYAAMEASPWFAASGLRGEEAYITFLDAWAGVAQQLYQRLPFAKLQIRNPHHDWGAAMQQIEAFLSLAPVV